MSGEEREEREELRKQSAFLNQWAFGPKPRKPRKPSARRAALARKREELRQRIFGKKANP